MRSKASNDLEILFRHRFEVLRKIALRLRELSVLPPFRANRSCLYIVNIFSNNLLIVLEYLTTTRMQVRGKNHLHRKRKAALALEVKVSEDIEVIECCGKWRQNWRFSFVKDLRQLSSAAMQEGVARLPGNMPFPRLFKSAKANLEIS